MNTNDIARVGALVGEPARTAMLLALMDGRALTARELADAAHITPATASRHLALLVDAALLEVQHQGRHRYHRLASPDVARVLEGMMQLARSSAAEVQRVATGPRDAELRRVRTCYDHLAGRLGVAMAIHLEEAGAVVLDGDAAHLTEHAPQVLAQLGLAVEGLARAGSPSRPACRPCLDWSERRTHLAGRLGALLCAHCLQSGWLTRRVGTRALTVTPPGALALRNWMGTQRWSEVEQG